MSLENLTKQVNSAIGDKKMPPVELWDPPYCGELDIVIKANGDWFYNGTIFKRLALVKLLASVLKKEGEEYFLVTPVEKIKITVEDAPLLITQWRWLDDSQSEMTVSTPLGDEFVLNESHLFKINQQGELYVNVRRNLFAKVHRNVYYQWIDLAQEVKTENGTELAFTSAGTTFSIGVIDG